MAAIHVCGLSHLGTVVARSGARHVASLINAGMAVPYPLSVPLENRLMLGFNDIAAPVTGLTEPARVHAMKLIDFVRAWDQQNPLVIHCWMGVSRSTAGAFIAQCALMPEADEAALARALREASPEATPNSRLVHLADDLLGRDGRMVRAIAAIGRGAETFEGVPFSVQIA
ncbi:MAG: protein tyrosine phosphatase [Rhizobiales bacterium]|nr:protein tyrosine phosphatase [Hyphomicrobiales bacterium]